MKAGDLVIDHRSSDKTLVFLLVLLIQMFFGGDAIVSVLGQDKVER